MSRECEKITRAAALACGRLQEDIASIERRSESNHPRVVELRAQLDENLQLINRLEVLKQRVGMQVPSVPKGASLVHGRVTDEEERGIAGLNLCIVDEQGCDLTEPIAATTDAVGYAALVLDARVAEQLREKGVPLHMEIRDGQTKVLHKCPEVLSLARICAFSEITIPRPRRPHRT